MKKNDKNQDNRYTQTITVTNSIMEKSRSVNQISPNQITEDKAYPIILFTWSFELVDNSRNQIITGFRGGEGVSLNRNTCFS